MKRVSNILLVFLLLLVALVPSPAASANPPSYDASSATINPISKMQFLFHGDSAYAIVGPVAAPLSLPAAELMIAAAGQTLTSEWVDASGTSHKIVTPVGMGEGDASRALQAHDKLLDAAQKKWPPVKPPPAN